jgi:hypothetical protein
MFYFIIIITLFTFSNNVSLLVLGKSVFVILLTCFSSVVISLLDHRSRKGAELLGKILGLKEFIETSEIDRIIELTNEDSQFFYKLLPYATVFGLTDLWSSKFEFVPKVKEGSDVLDSLPTYDPLMLKDLGLLINLGHIAQKNFEVSKTFSQLSKPDGHYDALKDNPRTPVPHLGGIQSKGSIRGIFETIDFFSSLFSGGGFGGGGGHHW